MEELRNVVVGGSLTPNAATLTQLLSALRLITSSAALVRRTSSQSIPADTNTIVSWQAEVYDDAAMWSAGTPGRLIVPTGGAYARVSGGLSFDQGAGGALLVANVASQQSATWFFLEVRR
ncbi:MAG: hypothetical protein L0Y38_00330 [Methylococcaceae bacterium]|nr:hypothetical protein [Methylococcaceae bacterium]